MKTTIIAAIAAVTVHSVSLTKDIMMADMATLSPLELM
jgi:hypothetical protein